MPQRCTTFTVLALKGSLSKIILNVGQMRRISLDWDDYIVLPRRLSMMEMPVVKHGVLQ